MRSLTGKLLFPTNITMRQLDHALLRPGRLMGSHEFGRLNQAQAQRLAQAKGLNLPDQHDFSLAELYCASAETNIVGQKQNIGFVKAS